MPGTRPPTVIEMVRGGAKLHHDEALAARALMASWCAGGRIPPGRVGMDTYCAMCARLYLGRTVEQAASCEYLYRWWLALDARPEFAAALWGVPHALGL